MSCVTRCIAVAVALVAAASLAQRPPQRQHAPAHITAGTDGLTPGARFLASLPPATRRALQKDGQVVLDGQPGEARSMVRAVIRFDRPRDEVFAIITQPSDLASYQPHVTQSKTFGARTEDGEAIDTVVSFIFTLRYRTQHWFYPEEARMEWNLDPSGADGLTEQLGYFQLYELDEKTTVAEYGTKVVARSGLLDFFRGVGERGGVTEALTAIRKHVSQYVTPVAINSRR